MAIRVVGWRTNEAITNKRRPANANKAWPVYANVVLLEAVEKKKRVWDEDQYAEDFEWEDWEQVGPFLTRAFACSGRGRALFAERGRLEAQHRGLTFSLEYQHGTIVNLTPIDRLALSLSHAG